MNVSASVSLFDLKVSLLCLQNLYESIKNEPFKIPEDDGNDLTHTFFNPDREGWLLKLGMCIQSCKNNPAYVDLGQQSLNSVPRFSDEGCLFVYDRLRQSEVHSSWATMESFESPCLSMYAIYRIRC